MILSKNKLYKITKINKNEVLTTAELLERSGYIKQIHSGLFVQLHFMKLVTNNLEKLIRQELKKAHALEIGLNQLQHVDLWEQTGRLQTYGSEMFKLKDRNNKEMVITGTNEELVTHVAKHYIESYRDLSFCFFQINNKFRDEIRCNNGLIRCKEFSMMDAYSFHESQEDLQKYYSVMRNAYARIFDQLGLKYRFEAADSGEIGGSVSEEIVIETVDGEIELGHIFQLDTKYSSALDVGFIDKDGTRKLVYMGCYGIGISRLAQVLAEIGRDGNNLNFHSIVAPYDAVIIVANPSDDKQAYHAVAEYHRRLILGENVYLDDRDNRVGEKLMEADLMGANCKIIFGKCVNDGNYEIKYRSFDKWTTYKIDTNIKVEI